MTRPEHEITSLHNARIRKLKKLRDNRHRRRSGLFLVEGLREISRALAAGLTLESLLCAPALLEPQAAMWLDTHAATLPVPTICSPAVFRSVAYLQEPEGLLACVHQPEMQWQTLGPITDHTLLLVAVGTEKPGNLGAMARTALAAGCQGLIAAGTPIDPFHPNAIRASTAAIFTLPVIARPEQDVRTWLSSNGLRIMPAMVDEQAQAYEKVNWRGPIALIIGPEDQGLDSAWSQAAQSSDGQAIRIPMRESVVDSLNASVAAGILLFHAAASRARP